MFQAQTTLMTFDTFITFALQPENVARNLELINGEVIEKRPVSSRNLDIITRLVSETRLHCAVTELPCCISTSDGPYRIGQNIISPDFAYKTTSLTKEYPDPPLWVADVISANDNIVEVSGKRRKYIAMGILYWELYPDELVIDVYAPGKPMKTYGINDAIMVNVIIGLTISISKLFR
jgi:Uma2 family endonuclease